MEWPRVTFVIATHNRRDVLLHTLEHVAACGLAAGEFETLVVDNASSDGTVEAVSERFASVKLLRQTVNRGPCAKNAGIRAARGEFVVFLDDDSYPGPRSVRRMIEHFRIDARLGAAVFTVTLPDGSRECSAYPDVCIGCGTGLRRRALLEVGGLPEDFFMAAEEYDLSLRLLDAGWRVRGFDDLHVTHLKTPASRFPSRVARLDARNNVMLAMRYFPDSWRTRYALAWLERYRLMAIANQQRRAFWLGAAEGIARGVAGEYRPMRREAFEQFARIDQTARWLSGLQKRLGLRRILFVDLGKNFLAYEIAARECGLEVVGIADERLGGRGLRYRGVPILSDADAMNLRFDAAVISNLSPVHSSRRRQSWQQRARCPVADLFQPGEMALTRAA
jgi:GT2 family glycosyltransferase